MKIVFTGGGTGGHFYPLIAVAERVNQIIDDEKILGAKLYYFSDAPYDKEMLFENNLYYEEIIAGKLRTKPSLKSFFSNVGDVFKTFLGVLNALFKLFSIYPDVIFGKGGYASCNRLFVGNCISRQTTPYTVAMDCGGTLCISFSVYVSVGEKSITAVS
jgi:UDP-N-acetylglucosamine--N-acetylmuramyl-(pentapeptide) pyrophosphoryl-undecaprenol N-acetylglucosamine transferase